MYVCSLSVYTGVGVGTASNSVLTIQTVLMAKYSYLLEAIIINEVRAVTVDESTESQTILKTAQQRHTPIINKGAQLTNMYKSNATVIA